MQLSERFLYHQIHPLKLGTDLGTALPAAVLFWQYRPATALLVGLVPSLVVSAALLRWADLTRYRASALGRYVRGFMTRRVELARLAGCCRCGVARGCAVLLSSPPARPGSSAAGCGD